MWPTLPISLDCLFLIVPSVFSNIHLHSVVTMKSLIMRIAHISTWMTGADMEKMHRTCPHLSIANTAFIYNQNIRNSSNIWRFRRAAALYLSTITMLDGNLGRLRSARPSPIFHGSNTDKTWIQSLLICRLQRYLNFVSLCILFCLFSVSARSITSVWRLNLKNFLFGK